MKPEDLHVNMVYLWRQPNGVEVPVRFVRHLPPQTPIVNNASCFPSVSDMRPRCEIEDVQTGQLVPVWVEDLREKAD